MNPTPRTSEKASASQVRVQQCKTLKQAERYQFGLYSQFDSVKLTASPRFSEAGQYVWEVKGAAK